MAAIVKWGSALAMALGISLAAGSAGAEYDVEGYQQCLRAGVSECLARYDFNAEFAEEIAACQVEFFANCRVHYGVPDGEGGFPGRGG